MGDRLLGPYRLMEMMASGPSGDEHVAWDTRLNRRVKLRVLPRLRPTAPGGEEVYAAFVDYLKRLSALRHPNVLAPVDHSPAHGDEAWYVVELTEGVSLRRLIDVLGRLPWTEAAMILHELAKASGFAQKRDVVHGHLKPAAVHLERRGRVAMAGFDVVSEALGVTGHNDGKLACLPELRGYLAPEVLANTARDGKSELFTLASVFYEMVTGRPPFANEDEVTRYATGDVDLASLWRPISHLPPELRDAVRSGLSVDPAVRPASAEAVAEVARQVLAAEGITDIRAGLRQMFAKQRSAFGDTVTPAATAKAKAAGNVSEAAGPSPAETPVKVSSGAPRHGTKPSHGTAAKRKDTKPTLGAKRDVEVGPAEAGPKKRRRSSLGKGRRDTSQFGQSSRASAKPTDRVARARADLRDIKPHKERGLTGALIVVGLLMLVGVAAVWAIMSLSGGTVTTRSTSREASAATEVVRRPTTVDPVIQPATPLPPRRVESPSESIASKARAQLAVKDYAVAERSARQGLGADPKNGDLEWVLAAALEGQDKREEAIETYLASDRRPSSTRGHLAAAQLLFEDKKYERVVETLDAAEQRGLANGVLYRLRGLSLAHLDRKEPAVEALTRAIELGEGEPGVRLTGAHLLEKLGRIEEARLQYRLVFDADPSSQAAERGLARTLGARDTQREPVKGSDPGQADEPAEAATTRLKQSVEATALELEAGKAFDAGDYGTAASQYEKAAELNPGDPRLLRNLAVALDRAGRADAAIAAWRQVVKRQPKDGEAFYRLAHLLRGEGRTKDALKAMQQAARLTPRRWQLHFDLGLLELDSSELGAAASSFRRVLKMKPKHAPALQSLAKALVDGGDYAAAVDVFERLSRVRRSDPKPLLHAAAIYAELGRLDDAANARRAACRRGAHEVCED